MMVFVQINVTDFLVLANQDLLVQLVELILMIVHAILAYLENVLIRLMVMNVVASLVILDQIAILKLMNVNLTLVYTESVKI